MTEGAVATIETGAEVPASRIYEVGYHIIPTVAEDQIEKIVSRVRGIVEQAGGNFIAEGAPAMVKLSYSMEAREGDKYVEHDKAHFGWIKFEAPTEVAKVLEETLNHDAHILRAIVFRTVREETRARMKAPTLREVKRTDTIRTVARRPEEDAGPVSEVDLDKALEDITADK